MQAENYERVLINSKSGSLRNVGNLISHVPWLPIPIIAAAAIILLFLDFQIVFEPIFLISTINIAVFIGGSILAAILAGRGYIAGGARTLLFLGCGLLLFGMASVSGSVLVSSGHINAGVTAHNIGALFAGLFHIVGAISISMYFTGAVNQIGRRFHVFGLYFLCALFMAVISALAINNMLPEFITGSGSTQTRSVLLSLTVAEYILSAIMFGLCDYQKKTIFFRWYWMGLALVGVGLASVALETLPGTPLSWLGRLSQSIGQLYIIGCLIAVSYRARTGNFPAGWGIGQSFRQIEDELRESQERFRASFENGSVPMVLTKFDCKLIKVNKAYCELLGYSESELVGHWFTEFTHPDDIDVNLRAIRDIEKGQINTFRMDKRYFRKDGKIIWVDMSTAVVRDEQKKALYLVSHFQDITERKLIENALRESEQRFRNLVEVTSDWVWTVDQNGVYTYSSPKIKDLLGYEPEEIVGKTPFDFMPPDEAARLRERFIELSGSHKPIINLENINLHKNGRRVVLETSGAPIFDSENRFVGYRGMDRDVTARKKAEESLRQSQEKYRHLVEGSNSIILRADNNMRLTFINEYGLKFFGYSADEIIGKRALGTIIPRISECGRDLAAMAEDLMQHPENYVTNVHQNMRKDGSMVWVSWANKALYDEQGELTEILAIGNDLSQLKEAEEELRKAKETVEEQVRNRTKQLQNVIDTLQGEVSDRILAEQALRTSQKELRALTSELSLAEERERRRIALLLHDHIGQLLAVTKMKLRAAQKTDGSTKFIEEIRPLIEEAIKTTRSLTLEISPPSLYTLGLDVALEEKCEKFAADHSITCIFEHNGKLDEVADDLRAVLYRSAGELLLNSLKHSNATSIKVSIGRQDHHVELKVQDNGSGFDISELTARTKSDKGFGLMSIRERINHLGGSMSIETCKDKGTTINILAPLQCALPPNP